MRISRAEQLAIRKVVELGKLHGFGNLITHLQTAWARTLVEDEGFSESTARESTGGKGMPFEMQDDLIERSEWDETGKRYR